MGVSSASDRRWDGAPCGQVSFGDALWWAASWVKIYDASGHIERPLGHSDSIPFALAP